MMAHSVGCAKNRRQSPPARLRSLEPQSARRVFIFLLSVERTESKKTQPFGQNNYNVSPAKYVIVSASGDVAVTLILKTFIKL